MQIDVVNMEGQKVGQMELADEVFGCKVREHLLWESVKSQRAAQRAGTHSTLTRKFVRGGGRKPYRQKGTGNARQGSTRSPNFVGGEKIFEPHPRDYEYTLPRKVKKAALASALSLRAQEKKLVIVERLVMETPKTKRMAGVVKSIRNLTTFTCLPPEGLNVYDILRHAGLIIAKDVVKAVEARIVGTGGEAAA
jgi:large subunit ribosomal protein L4